MPTQKAERRDSECLRNSARTVVDSSAVTCPGLGFWLKFSRNPEELFPGFVADLSRAQCAGYARPNAASHWVDSCVRVDHRPCRAGRGTVSDRSSGILVEQESMKATMSIRSRRGSAAADDAKFRRRKLNCTQWSPHGGNDN